MDHDEVQSLLGAYALDAVEESDAAAIEAHVLECPRCQQELAAHREVASLLGNSTAEAPSGGWDAITARLLASESVPAFQEVARHLPTNRASARRRRGLLVAGTSLLAAAAVALALLAVRVGNLDHQVGNYQAIERHAGLSQVVAAVLGAPHQSVALTSADLAVSAKVAIASGDHAYWLSSTLPSLPAGHTYQLWALSHGEVVSLGLIGPDPNKAGVFLLEPAISMLMVTAEPAGGVPKPTTPVLVSASLPT